LFTGRDFTDPNKVNVNGEYYRRNDNTGVAESTDPPVPSMLMHVAKQVPPLGMALEATATYGRYDTGQLKPKPLIPQTNDSQKQKVSRQALGYAGVPVGSYDLGKTLKMGLINEKRAELMLRKRELMNNKK
jgi:hypothetical protein